ICTCENAWACRHRRCPVHTRATVEACCSIETVLCYTAIRSSLREQCYAEHGADLLLVPRGEPCAIPLRTLYPRHGAPYARPGGAEYRTISQGLRVALLSHRAA